MSATTGTVKIRRWDYPALQAADGTVTRNESRDGSGSWVPATGLEFTPGATIAAETLTPATAQCGHLTGSGAQCTGRTSVEADGVPTCHRHEKGARAALAAKLADVAVAHIHEAPKPAKVRVVATSGDAAAPKARRQGKSTWELETPCPKGHTLTTETLYVMPSGRKQCKSCRAGYASNA
jgi:hypothetical protein